MFMTAMGGVALGLVISSLVADPKTAANIVPLVLIPQIIMGGALIKYEDMNRNLTLRLLALTIGSPNIRTTDKTIKSESKLQVPFVCQFIAMRWSYEEMIVAQAKLNPLTRRQERANARFDGSCPNANTPEQRARLNDLKDVLAFLSGLEADQRRKSIIIWSWSTRYLDGKQTFDRAIVKDAKGPITAEQLYVNQKVSDLISNAEMEQSDYRRGSKPNVFFGLQKRYFGQESGRVYVSTRCVLIAIHAWIACVAALDFATAIGSAKELIRRRLSRLSS